MTAAEKQRTEKALKQHWKKLNIKSNNYPALVRKNVPTKGQDYSLSELGAALLRYAKDNDVSTWANFLQLNKSDPWSDLSGRIFNSGKYGSVLKKLANLENAHFDSFLDEQLQKSEGHGKQETESAEPPRDNAVKSHQNASTGEGSDGRRPPQHSDKAAQADPRPKPTDSPQEEGAGNPKPKTAIFDDDQGPQDDVTIRQAREGVTVRPNAAGHEKSYTGCATELQQAPEDVTPGRLAKSNKKEGHSSGGSEPPVSPSPKPPPVSQYAAPDRPATPPDARPINGTTSTNRDPNDAVEDEPASPKPAATLDQKTPPRRSSRKAAVHGHPPDFGASMDSPSRNTRSQSTPQKGVTGSKRPNEEAFPGNKGVQPAKRGPGSTTYPCPRPGGCPTNSVNHIRRTACAGCKYDLLAHTKARKEAEEAAKKGKISSLPVVIKAARREVEKLGQLGCSVSLMVHTPIEGKQATRWVFASAGAKGNAFTEKYRGYFRKAIKHEGEVKVEGVAQPSQKPLDSADEDLPSKATGVGSAAGVQPAMGFTLSVKLEKMVNGFADRYPQDVIERMLTALRMQYVDEETAKELDMDALLKLFGNDMLGPCLRFKNSIKEL